MEFGSGSSYGLVSQENVPHWDLVQVDIFLQSGGIKAKSKVYCFDWKHELYTLYYDLMTGY